MLNSVEKRVTLILRSHHHLSFDVYMNMYARLPLTQQQSHQVA